MTAERPPRKLPSRQAIAKHWDIPDDVCERCGHKGFVERAHLISRYAGGLDLVCNLALLCKNCHQDMPNFQPGDEPLADRWVEMTKEAWWDNHYLAIADLVEAGELDLAPMFASVWPLFAEPKPNRSKAQIERDKSALFEALRPVWGRARLHLRTHIQPDPDPTVAMVRFVSALAAAARRVEEVAA